MEIRACPFCGYYGKNAQMLNVTIGITGSIEDLPKEGESWNAHVTCNHCDIEGPYADTREGAVEAWNRRPEPRESY